MHPVILLLLCSSYVSIRRFHYGTLRSSVGNRSLEWTIPLILRPLGFTAVIVIQNKLLHIEFVLVVNFALLVLTFNYWACVNG